VSLADLQLKTSYVKGRDDIAEDFYLPCMRRAVRYDRAVGYFRSTVFAVAWPALREFVVGNQGAMRILCSHVLADPDIDALSDGYAARVDAALAAHFREEVRGLLDEPDLHQPVRVLAALVASGTLEVKVAVLQASDRGTARSRIFHDKLGVFADAAGNTVIFKGSMNETWTGLAADGNLESVDVAATWLGDRDFERAADQLGYFDDLWANRFPGLVVRSFPDVARSELERIASPDWEQELADCLAKPPAGGDPRGRSLRPHQAAGLASWRANARRGVLEFATGSGKTFTAISAIHEAVQLGEVPIVVVPDKVLFKQWFDELRETLEALGTRILRAGSGYTRWRSALTDWTAPGGDPRLVLATIQTASTPEFLSSVAAGARTLLVVDEVHRAGSPHHRRLLDESRFSGARLGLSATPRRAGDAEGTAAIIEFFRGILEPRYTLADAVRDNVLCKYFYRPHPVSLEREEQVEWDDLSAQVGQLNARIRGGDDVAALHAKLKRLLIRRARVVKQAAAKVPLAARVIREHHKDGQRWLVYCDDLTQLRAVCQALELEGLSPLPFHSQMEGDRSETLRWLDRRGGIVVAIKCLDEGVDVPTVSHALILASSRNPREYIQRRGRVLRKSKGKALAYVHDVIVLPATHDPSAGPDPITAGELARAVQFAENADNPACAADLQGIAIDQGIDWRELVDSGIEVDDDDDE